MTLYNLYTHMMRRVITKKVMKAESKKVCSETLCTNRRSASNKASKTPGQLSCERLPDVCGKMPEKDARNFRNQYEVSSVLGSPVTPS